MKYYNITIKVQNIKNNKVLQNILSIKIKEINNSFNGNRKLRKSIITKK